MADLNGKIPDSSLFIGLPEGTPRVAYTNMEDIRCLVDRRVRLCCSDPSQSPFVIVVNIPRTFLQEFDSLYPDRGPRISTNLHDRVLVFEIMAGKVHEVAALALEAYLIAETTNMNLHYTTICSGTSRATSDVFTKEPDGSFTLKHRHWPILTIEAGVSESDAKLNMDARGWLESPESETEVVITIKVNRRFPQMTFKKWEKSITLQHRATRSSHQPAEATQTVHVRYSNDITEVTGNMVIPLAKLAGRGPQNTNEHDIIITEAAFEMISKKVWIAQEFL
ncbi:hypothetical protein McanCB56680_000430 [Microsporum canis]|uniref:Uncharacterized protein n=1 Tax=Arthroderma otae (strain ATCC MYA-4605 / CBS 113480) TaxID=554155 RepID=C5FXQ7_ARTOC|nr:conserved hypothetical protein [Microsporum canis CBS 113480]EEQ35097.1 conserved hypothetical protein [Microsporum canis CBS 113480]